MTLTRRDRYALALALEQCRAGRGYFACLAALTYGDDVAERVRGAGNDAWHAFFMEGRGPVPGDLLRARLALLLRVLLRADGLDAWSGAPGGYDMEGCRVCHWRGEVPGREHDEECRFCGGYGWTLAPIHITPLWDLAARGASR